MYRLWYIGCEPVSSTVVYILVQTIVASNALCADFTIPQYKTELIKLDLDHTGCDLTNSPPRETFCRPLPLQLSMHAKSRPLT